MQQETLVDNRAGYTFAIVHDVVLRDEGLTTHEKLLYCVLSSYADQKTKSSFPSVKTLADKTGSSKNTVRKSTKSLHDKGLLEIKRRQTGDGFNYSNVYVLCSLDKRYGSTGEPPTSMSEPPTSTDELGVVQQVNQGGSTGEPELESLELESFEEESLNYNKGNDDDFANAIQAYQQNIGVINPAVSQDIEAWIDDMGELVSEAIKRAALNNKPWPYARAIIKNWYNNNIRTLEDVEAQSNEKKKDDQYPKKVQPFDWQAHKAKEIEKYRGMLNEGYQYYVYHHIQDMYEIHRQEVEKWDAGKRELHTH
ncbi:DnaD/phage-associated family protein [Salsuginibacillus halophilus]|uniref:DnaD/phage-associated family protein n=1 Tax=Salsuginibacillus halophilus TaxID=517424 RepID=A0A2P8H669_9BACI|nr:DnaD domain protein [Salsuginibacillus halophilus]PSL41735.1 DnaD/phage-associated family protein [Salsuginibacillus halophilus]